MTETPRCDLSDMPPEWCAHCRGDDGTTGVYFAPTPPPVRTHWHPRTRTATYERGTPAPSPLPAVYSVLCGRGDDCRPPEHGGPRRTEGRSHVCDVCEDRTTRDLSRVVDAWPDLQAALTALPAVDPTKEGGKPDAVARGLILNEAASEASAAVAIAAHFYARLVRTERGFAPSQDATPPGLLRWLAKGHVPWLLRHSDKELALAFAADAADLRRGVESAAYPAGWRTIPVGIPCGTTIAPDPDRGEDFPAYACGGTLAARVRPDLDRLPDLVCDVEDTHRVPPSVWRRHDWARKHGVSS